jgi:hypothetical protein
MIKKKIYNLIPKTNKIIKIFIIKELHIKMILLLKKLINL